MLEIPKEDRVYFQEGREAHRIIQNHVSLVEDMQGLNHIRYIFHKIEQKRVKQINDTYELVGFCDGMDVWAKRLLEIKTGQPWSAKKFKDSMQRKIYAWLWPEYEESLLITAPRNPDEWNKDTVKTIILSNTEQDRLDAVKWIKGGIAILEAGNFTGGLDENGRCTDRWCEWGNSCRFK